MMKTSSPSIRPAARPTASWNGKCDAATASGLMVTADAIDAALAVLNEVGSVSLDWQAPGAAQIALEAYYRRLRGLIDLARELRSEARTIDPIAWDRHPEAADAIPTPIVWNDV